jgi:hypothetical protein
MRLITATLVFVASLCFASHCPDARLRQAVIGGDTIDGSVILNQKPLKSAQIRLYFSTGKTAWVGMTDKKGSFRIAHLPPGTYRLDVRGWGSTTIRLDPTLTELPNGQMPSWAVQLMDNECVGYSESVD